MEQGDRCVEVSPLRGDDGVVSFYDYRTIGNAPRGLYSSYMPAGLQRADASRLFLYEGPDGVSLVMVHNANGGDGGDGSAATFRFRGLPSGGDWVVEDDNYVGQDDRFSRNRIDWSWYGDRTDGAAFRGLDRGSTEVTVVPAFDEQAALYDAPVQRSGETRAWQFLTGSVGNPETVALDMNAPVTIRTGHCTPDETPPSAALSGEDGVAGRPVSFDASGSSDDREIAAYRWDFDGDGDVERTTTDPTVAYEYGETGTYDASVTVVDEAGNADSAQARITVETDDPPEAAFRTSDAPTEGSPVTFDASNSTDDTGIAAYRWSFGGNATATGQRVTHTFDANGTYTVTLEVVDEGGNNATTTTEVEVLPADETAPNATVRANRTNVTAGALVSFDAANSSDNRGVSEYRWDFGDGTGATGPRATHAYDSAGTYDATVTVADAGGNAATANVTVVVRPPDRTDPAANLSVGTNRTETGTEVAFDASNSTDDGGSGIAEYRWDFDGDGEVERTTGNATVRHAYDSNGTYDASVTVVDEAGNPDEAAVSVRVERDRQAHRGKGGDDGGNAGGGSTSLGPPPVVTRSESRGPNAGLVDVRNGRADETIRADLPASAVANRTGVTFRKIAVDLADDDTHFAVRTARPAAGATNASLPADVTLGSLSVESKYVRSRTVAGVTYEVAIERSRLADAGLAPADLTAYERTGGASAAGDAGERAGGAREAWAQANASVVSSGETVVLRVRTDGFGPIALGADRSVTLADAELDAAQVEADEPVSVTATLRNEADRAEEFAANLTVDDEVVATETVEVPAGATKRVTVEATLAPGTHRVGLGGRRVGNVSVAEPTADLGVADVSLNSSAIPAGGRVAIAATVENTGSAAGERTVALTLFGEQLATKTVRVPAHETRRVTFARTVNAPGSYTARVGDETAALEVESGGDGEDGRTAPAVPGFGVGAAAVALVAALLVALSARTRR
ncbi:PKD domain-containing protein [Halorussus caseinilyticus]|uniref:PKD domain-containing protein n=1 Tax=Halorussus caseinilyticus TaxID=3034025 RepID=A0ABD5WME8_9EURY